MRILGAYDERPDGLAFEQVSTAPRATFRTAVRSPLAMGRDCLSGSTQMMERRVRWECPAFAVVAGRNFYLNGK